MAEQMLLYINEQPKVWNETIDNLTDISHVAKEMKNADEIIFIGSGSSYYAAQCACFLLNKENGPSFIAAVPTRLNTMKKQLQTTVYIAVSQSGKSTSTQAVADKLCSDGANLWTVTSDKHSPLAKCGKGHVLIPCNEENIGPKTKGMSATVLTLYLLGKEICSPITSSQLSLLKQSFEAFTQNIQISRLWAGECTELCKNANSITVVADGAALPLAKEGALKLLETLYIPVSTWEFEEYLHGVNNIIGPKMLHIFVLNESINRERMNKLIDYCISHNADCLVIDCEENAKVKNTKMSLKCTGNEITLPYELLIPFQILSAIVSQEKGINCDKPRYPDFYAALGTKLGAKSAKE